MAHQVTLPFVLIVCAFNVLESIRTRAHVTQLIGALRGAMSKAGAPPTPEAKAEAIEILIQSLYSETAAVRKTAAGQLQKLTGQDLGSALIRSRTGFNEVELIAVCCEIPEIDGRVRCQDEIAILVEAELLDAAHRTAQ